MICRILLLITLTACVCGMFEYHNTPLYYQAAENEDVAVEWRFSSREANNTIPSLKIHCVFLQPELKVLYHLDNSVEEPQHQQFAGRVQCDKDALTTGRVRLHLSRVRTEDSGLYLCRMFTKSGKRVRQFSLNITEAPVAPTPWTQVIPSYGRIGLYASLGLTAVAAVVTAAGLAVSRWTSSSCFT